MRETLAQNDELTDELLAADPIVARVPMYNFDAPAGLKACIDNILRAGNQRLTDSLHDAGITNKVVRVNLFTLAVI